MRRDRRYLWIDPRQYRLLVIALNNMRTRLIGEGRPTDAVDDVLVKVIRAPIKK